MNERMVIHFGCDVVVKTVRLNLAGQGMTTVRSFDLRSALAAHSDCPCPHHGTAGCDCQFVVLLVYGQANRPVVVTIHGHDGRTEMRIVDDAVSPADPRLAEQVAAALLGAAVEISLAHPTEAACAS